MNPDAVINKLEKERLLESVEKLVAGKDDDHDVVPALFWALIVRMTEIRNEMTSVRDEQKRVQEAVQQDCNQVKESVLEDFANLREGTQQVQDAVIGSHQRMEIALSDAIENIGAKTSMTLFEINKKQDFAREGVLNVETSITQFLEKQEQCRDEISSLRVATQKAYVMLRDSFEKNARTIADETCNQLQASLNKNSSQMKRQLQLQNVLLTSLLVAAVALLMVIKL